MNRIVVAALYQFKKFPEFKEFKAPLLDICNSNNIKGTLLLADEGINGTIAGKADNISKVKKYLVSELGFDNLEYKESYTKTWPFYRMKVKLKKEIVTLGVDGISPSKKVGTYVEPSKWDSVLEKCDVLIDTRNEYEVELGTFKGASNPHTTSFREFPDYVKTNLDANKHKKVAMFCTGGIRCEKASSYMLEQGFEEVYHLKGGILKYLEEIPKESSSWSGECFVFDERVAVDEKLMPGSYTQCNACRMPLSEQEMTSDNYVKGVSCPHCYDKTSATTKSRFAERQKQVELAKTRGEQHIGR